MEGETFDDLVKRLTAARLSRLDALRGVLASAAVGLAGATRSPAETAAKKPGKGKGRKGKSKGKKAGAQAKVTLCHKPGTPDEQTISVGAPAVDAHLGHGDTRGPCPGPTTTTTSTTTTTAAPTTTTTSTTTTPAPVRCTGQWEPFNCACLSQLAGGPPVCASNPSIGPSACANTCTPTNSTCTGGRVCVINPCCQHPEGVGVCMDPCPNRFNCTCTTGAQGCASSQITQCGTTTA
jgi:hypothetical protein